MARNSCSEVDELGDGISALPLRECDIVADDPAISDAEESHRSRTRRAKSKSSSDVLSLGTSRRGQESSCSHHRRHSESSSESLSNEFLQQKGVLSRRDGASPRMQQSPRSRSILSKIAKYKSKRAKSGNNSAAEPSLGISGPLNVHHVIHVEWDEKCARFKVSALSSVHGPNWWEMAWSASLHSACGLRCG